MKKKIALLFIIIIMLCGCNQKDDNVILENNNSINYEEKINLYDIVKLKEGTMITDNYQLNTTNIGEQKIEITYKNIKNKTKKYKFTINVIDTVPPIINSYKNYYLVVGETFNPFESMFYGDNEDKKPSATIQGDYDTSTPGDYNLKFIVTDHSNNKTEKDFILHVKDSIEDDEEISSIDIKDIIDNYKTNKTEIGIDVSEWQYDIDFEKVKESGVSFVIVRIGFGPDEEKQNIIDEKFFDNIKNAKEAGLKVGVYFYSYALTTEEAKKSANWIIDSLNGETLDLPIFFDWENWSRFKNYNLNFTDLNNIKDVFLDTIIEKGYDAANYGSAFYLNNVWNTNNYKTWLAHYTDKTNYPKDYFLWQLTSTATVEGIDSYVDVNILYK